jgi:hypothetical protein
VITHLITSIPHIIGSAKTKLSVIICTPALHLIIIKNYTRMVSRLTYGKVFGSSS